MYFSGVVYFFTSIRSRFSTVYRTVIDAFLSRLASLQLVSNGAVLTENPNSRYPRVVLNLCLHRTLSTSVFYSNCVSTFDSAFIQRVSLLNAIYTSFFPFTLAMSQSSVVFQVVNRIHVGFTRTSRPTQI